LRVLFGTTRTPFTGGADGNDSGAGHTGRNGRDAEKGSGREARLDNLEALTGGRADKLGRTGSVFVSALFEIANI
jgi:hypothetical protein